MDIEYLKGTENVIADTLSRVSPQPVCESKTVRDVILVHMLTKEIPADTASIPDFPRATPDDTTSGLLMQAVVNRWTDARKDCHPLLVDYWTYREEISAENGLLFKGHRPIVPEKLRNRTLQTVDKMQL